MKPPRSWIAALVVLTAGGIICFKTWPKKSAVDVTKPVGKADLNTEVLPKLPLAAKSQQAQPAPFERFEKWTQEYSKAAPALRTVLTEEGVQLARERRAVLLRLIENDPERALALALSVQERQDFPKEVAEMLEQRVSGHADYQVVATVPAAGSPAPAAVIRRVSFHDDSYQAYVYGRRLVQGTQLHIPLNGIVLEGRMAVAESPLRVLAPGEQPDPTKILFPEVCEISGNPAGPNQAQDAKDPHVIVEVGDEVHYLCSGGHIAMLEKQLIARETGPAAPLATPPVAGTANSAYTEGDKHVLFIRVRFSNQIPDYEPETAAASDATIVGANAFISENSYGKTAVVGTITPVYTLPHDESWYNSPSNDPSGYAQKVLDDARVTAANPSTVPANAALPAYDYSSYDFDVVRYNGGPGSFSGQAYIGLRGVWLKSDSAGVLSHELGHNFGLSHANRWNYTSEDVLGAGSNQEYGDVFDTMGVASAGHYSFNAGHRSLLGWLPPGNVQTITASGTYRVYSYDQPTLTFGQYYLLKIRKDADRDYWGEFRQQWSTNRWTQNGLQLRWDPWAQSNGGSQLLDTQPANNIDAATDSAVVIGRTFADRTAGIYMTPVGKGGTSPESLDVVVNIGTFTGNRAPAAVLSPTSIALAPGQTTTFTVSATDPDGDMLAYDWEFDNGTVGPNAPLASTSWSSPGVYRVLVTVSDMKGKKSVAAALVQVGSPSTYLISGRITDNFGRPAQGVRVHNGLSATFYRGTFTDDAGNYVITNVNPGTYMIAAASESYSSVAPAGFSNPVHIPADTSSADFVATLPPPTVNIAASRATTSESPGPPGVFTFSRQGDAPMTVPLVVRFQMGGTASFSGDDYTLESGTVLSFDSGTGAGSVTIPAGAASADVRLNAIDDTLLEGTETAIATLANDPSYLVGDTATATVNIADNDAPDYYTELFYSTSKPFNLNGQQLTFTPMSDTTYRGGIDPASSFPTSTTGAVELVRNGTVMVPLSGGSADDGFWKVNLPGTPVLFFGATYGQIYINTNGSVTFNQGDGTSTGTVNSHFFLGRPRVAAYWRDLDPRAGGTISYLAVTTPGLERTVVTFQDVPYYGDLTRHASFQIELWTSGVVTLTWIGSTPGDPLVGLSAGLGAPVPFFESDLSLYPPAPATFAKWRLSEFTSAELSDPTRSGPNADSDGDGLSNLVEYAFGLNPKVADSAGSTGLSVVSAGGKKYLALTFARRIDADDVTLTPQFSGDLNSWSTDAIQVGSAVPLPGVREQVTFRDTVPMLNANSRFGRVQVTTP